jgi:murein L,D-transpeptidase YcbB/YkuD
MSKYDELMKQAEFFEKLAIYSNKGEFLKAIAQPYSDTYNFLDDNQNDKQAQLKQLLGQIKTFLDTAGITDESVISPLTNAILFNNVEINKINQGLKKVYLQMPATLAGNKHTELMSLMNRLNSLLPKAQEAGGTAQAPKTNTQPTISRNQQAALSRINTIEGIGSTLTIDGIFGPETRKALDVYKAKLAPHLSDQDALQLAELQATTLPKYKY